MRWNHTGQVLVNADHRPIAVSCSAPRRMHFALLTAIDRQYVMVMYGRLFKGVQHSYALSPIPCHSLEFQHALNRGARAVIDTIVRAQPHKFLQFLAPNYARDHLAEVQLEVFLTTWGPNYLQYVHEGWWGEYNAGWWQIHCPLPRTTPEHPVRDEIPDHRRCRQR